MNTESNNDITQPKDENAEEKKIDINEVEKQDLSNFPSFQLISITELYNVIQGLANVFDLRSTEDYQSSHVWKAINLHIEDSHLSLESSEIENISQLKCSSHDSQRFKKLFTNIFVVYANGAQAHMKCRFLFSIIHKQLSLQNGNKSKPFAFRNKTHKKVQYLVLNCSYLDFQSKHPFLCISANESDDMNVESKRECESMIVKQKRWQRVFTQCGYPNIILDNELYLGDARMAINWNVFHELNITHVVNVTAQVPNQFSIHHKIEEEAEYENMINELSKVYPNILPSFVKRIIEHPIQYLKIELMDSYNVDIQSSFDKVFEFIQNALHDPLLISNQNNNENTCEKQCNRVFVHCQMGISRSSTMVIQYLMRSRNLSLADAYEYVWKKRSDIYPNNGFLQQLMDLEKRLNINGDGTSTIQQLQDRNIRDLTVFYKFCNQAKGKKSGQRSFAVFGDQLRSLFQIKSKK